MERRQRITSGPLRMPSGKDKVISSVQPNAAVKEKYQGKMERLVEEMQRSLVWHLRAGYRANEPAVAQLAEDAAPASALKRIMDRLAKYWQQRFDEAAPRMAAWFATNALERSESQLRSILREAGFSVRFDPTRASTDVFQATLDENVGLIRSIASEHLGDVRGIVMRGIQAGRDAQVITEELQHRYGITYRRAANIARDQNNKATAAMARTRKMELGLFEADWQHSHGGRQPRPDHVAAHGKRFDIRQGCLISGEYIQPGELINCGCTAKSVIPGF